jgi:iron complex outermembrane recepter protein
MKIVCSFLICLLFVSHTQAQVASKITGTVKDNAGVLQGATVYLYGKDSVLKKTSFSDAAGEYVFEQVRNGNYFLKITFTGKKIFSGEIFSFKGEDLKMPAITLEDKAGELGEVEVTARKNFIERRVDRTVVNPDVLISNAGTTALEVLEKSPGVQVTVEGIISLRGKNGVQIFIDDKPTYLSAADLAGYLRSVPAANIESIEIMTNPPAKYDAAGNAGIINIRMKKIKTKGVNGNVSLSYGQGVYARTNNSFSINYRNNKVNLFSTVSYNNNNTFQDLTIRRTYADNNGNLQSYFTQNSFFKRNPSGFNAKLGADYYVSNKTTLGVILSGFENSLRQDLTNKAVVENPIKEVTSRVNSIAPTRRSMKSKSANANMLHKFNNKGKEFSVNVDYITYNGNQNNELLNLVYNPAGSLLNRSNLISKLPSEINIASAKVDYTTPLKNGQKFETGVKASFVATDNIADFFDENNGLITPNYSFSNRFKYNENIQAAYVNYNIQKKKFSWQLGLRLESTQIEGKQFGNPQQKDSSFTRNYTNLFPTVFMQYVLDSVGKHVLGLSVGRRINRPNYQDMNPFTYPFDLFTLYSGNPFLQPTFTYNSEVSYTYNNKITTALSFDYTNNVISETIEQKNGIFYSRPGNIGKQINLSISVNGSLQILKWWSFQFYAEGTYNDANTTLYGQRLLNRGFYFIVNPVNLFQINKKWSAELAGSYQSRVFSAQFVLIPVGQVRMAVAKKIMKDKGTLKLGLNDMFYTFQPGGDIKGLGASTASWKSFLDSRVATFTFSYRFNKGKGAARRESNSADSEKGRVNAN